MKIHVKAKILLTLSIIMATVSGSLLAERQYKKPGSGIVKFVTANETFTVEVVSTPQQQQTGLMHRESLAQDGGMLFVFEQVDKINVWMLNTLIPLDIIFISEQDLISDFILGLQPCTQSPCPISRSAKPAKYMLEINAGAVVDKNLTIGDKMLFFQ